MARFLASVLVLLSSMSLVLSLTTSTRTSATKTTKIQRAAGRVLVVYGGVEGPIGAAPYTGQPDENLAPLPNP